MGDTDSDEERLEIDESAIQEPPAAVSMPNLDTFHRSPVKSAKGVSIDWAPERNPVYGSAEFIPPKPKTRAKSLRKEFVDAGTQHRDDDTMKFCDTCIKGQNYQMQVEMILLKHGTSIEELTGGGEIGPDFVEKFTQIINNPKPKQIQVSQMQVQRITKRALPGLLPLPNIEVGAKTTKNDINDAKVPQIGENLNKNQGFEYTEENIRMSQVQYMPFNTTVNPFNLQTYQPTFTFTNNALMGETTPNYQTTPSESPSMGLNFYVNTLNDDEPENDANVTPDTPKNDESDKKSDVESAPIGESTPINTSEGSETPFGGEISSEATPKKVSEENEADDALVIATDADFVEGFEDKVPEVTPSKPDLNKSLERQSILAYEEDDNTPRRNRFAKIGAQGNSSAQNPRFSSNKKQKQRRPRYNNSPPGSNMDDISPFKSNLFPQMHPNTVSGNKSNASYELFTEFTKVCRDFLYKTCTGNSINCNGNHKFPDAAWVQLKLNEMTSDEVQKFIKSCYKSVACCLRYFPILSKYFGTHNLKHLLVEAIAMAESDQLLLINYKWIVDGLIRARVAPNIAVTTLLEKRKNFSPYANRMVVEIICKTNLEGCFLEKLIEISENSSEVFDIDMFHKFMVLAMKDNVNIEGWKILIENILEKFNQNEEILPNLDHELINTFVNHI
ncbi:uncharacterized protein LOC134833925 isoform X2 [Culicoides brevitarsis]